MKVILSRKGFDGTYGGCPSPILPDGKDSGLPGAGTLMFSEDLNLTALGQSHSRWKLIDVLKDKSIVLSYHDKSKCIKDGYFQSAARGQEFVFEENALVNKWAERLIMMNFEEA